MTSRVGVNLAWLVPGVVGGSEEATIGALRGVADLGTSSGVDVVLFGLGALLDVAPDLGEHFEFHRLDLNGHNKVRRVLAETTELPKASARAGIDLMHHAGGVVPFRSAGRVTLAIHDTQPLDLPQHFSLVKRRYLGAMIPRSARRAAAVTVPSEFVKRQLTAAVGIDPGKVTVVPWSVPVAAVIDDVRRAEVLRRHGIHRPFVIYPAITYAHKNHATLLDAVARTGSVGSAGPALDLVLTGAPGPLDDAVARRAAEPDLSGRVHVLGRVPEAELAALMAAASVVAVPSTYEGFGLPALEGLAAGRPTVVADAGSLPEVVDGAAIVVDPFDVAGWAAALGSAAGESELTTRLVAAGRGVAASCTPTRTATRLVEVWTGALGRPGPASSRTARNHT